MNKYRALQDKWKNFYFRDTILHDNLLEVKIFCPIISMCFFFLKWRCFSSLLNQVVFVTEPVQQSMNPDANTNFPGIHLYTFQILVQTLMKTGLHYSVYSAYIYQVQIFLDFREVKDGYARLVLFLNNNNKGSNPEFNEDHGKTLVDVSGLHVRPRKNDLQPEKPDSV